jgi:Fe-S-cluster-containing hydrogenase component 2
VVKNSYRIVINSDICTGCRVCELTCAFVHTGSFTPENSRIHVEKDEFNGKDIPYICIQCEERHCVKNCPTGALEIVSETGAIKVNEELCIGCGICVRVCPYNGVRVHKKNKKALICDLCNGDPECVKRCPVGALSLKQI